MDKIGLDRTQATKPGCSHPIPVRMRCADTSTGEIYLGRTIEKDCGSRLAERCLHCSEIYKRDAMSVFNEGVANTETPVTHYTFITFTAPGSQTFGRTHQRVVKKRKANKSHVVRCSCKHTHREDDVRIGTPINPSTYRYDLAAASTQHRAGYLPSPSKDSAGLGTKNSVTHASRNSRNAVSFTFMCS